MARIHPDTFNFHPGRRLGRYVLGSRLGAGYEGEVYHVTEQRTGIERVAKFFYPHRFEDRTRSVKVARKLHRLRDCRVVLQHHDHGQITWRGETIDYLVSDLAHGELLDHLVSRQRGKRLMPFEALHLTYAIAQGVAAIHALREYHGDIHGDNILVERHGIGFRVRLIDMFINVDRASPRASADVVDIVGLLYTMVGGPRGYPQSPKLVKDIVCGRRRESIVRKFPNAGALRDFMDAYQWPEGE